MDIVKDWVSFQRASRSLLSARPFKLFHETLEDDHNSEGITDVGQGSSQVASSSSPNQESDASAHSQLVAAEAPCTSHSSITNTDNKDPFSKVDALQVIFLRLIHRIGLSPENLVVSQVLYRLQLTSMIRSSESDVKRGCLSVDGAKVIAAEKEASNGSDLDFSFKILVLGKTGVGKSATINSIFNQKMTGTNAFQPATDHIEEFVGTIKGVRITIIDTPGLSPSDTNQGRNRKLLLGVKRYIRKSPPDIVLYFERLDVINRGYSDFHLLKLISVVFGPSIWFNTILVMTHSSSGCPEGPDGYPVSYEAFVSKHTSLVQHCIQKAVSHNQLENPILLVENHPLCRTNMEGEKILPNGTVWKQQFLLLCISSKILADANRILKFQDSLQMGHVGPRLPSLPHLLAALLRPHSSKNSSAFDDEVDASDMDDSGDDYDNLPPIRILTKAQFQRLTKSQKNDYLDELDYRETLYLKKQWKEELRRRIGIALFKEESSAHNRDTESETSPDVVPLPDMTIPLSFDSDDPVYRYRCVLTSNKWLFRPVLDSQGWDHDVGFDGVNLESSIDMENNFHAFIMGQMSKEKEEFNLQTECAAKYMGPGGSSLCAGIDIQTAGNDFLFTVRGDADFKNLSCNKTGCGLSLTSFHDMRFYGAKIEDSISFWRKFKVGFNMGCIGGCNQMAYGGGLEATVKGKDYPVRDDKLTLALTLLSLDKEVVFGGSIQSQFRAGHGGKMSVHANFNSRKLGQISLKTSSTEHIEIALLAVISIARTVLRRRATNEPPEH